MNKFVLSLIAVLLLLTLGCSEDDLNIDVESAIPVRVEGLEFQPIKEYAFATGTAYSVNDAILKTEQVGFYNLLKNRRTGQQFAMGDEIKAGEVVVRLKNPEYENQIAFDSKKLNFDISQREFDKQKDIYDKGGITLRELTDAERAFIDSRYAFDNAKLQLAKLEMTAPFDGVIVDLPFHGPNQLIAIGETMVQFMDYTRLFCEVTLPGREADRVLRDQSALVTNYSQPEDTLIGRVTQVSPALDPESRMFKLTIEINNDSLTLRPGMFVKVDIIVDQKDSALVIPRDIILDRRGSKTVFVVEKGIAVQRTLETGLSNQNEIEVLSGLEEKERLVTEGFETLRHRSRVKVIK